MEQQWGSEDDGCRLEIGFTKPIESGLVQMYASFEFIAITGIFRFVNPDALGQKKTPKKPTLDENEDEEYSNNEYEEPYDHGSASAQFLFPKLLLPSSRKREFSFRWRGEETGEGEIQLYSDKKLCSIRFESPNALSGVFISSLTGKVEFRGIREESETKAKRPQKQKEASDWLDPGHVWFSKGEAAYESARKSRWG